MCSDLNENDISGTLPPEWSALSSLKILCATRSLSTAWPTVALNEFVAANEAMSLIL
jgi:hypothetical protein